MRIIGFLAIVSLMVSCSKDNVKISGSFSGIPNDENIFLELVTTNGQKIIDSTKTNDGDFKFKLKTEDQEPGIYNVRHKDQVITLLLSPGERVKLNALGNIALTYTVSGSQGSTLMQEIASIMNGGAATLDSLTTLYTKSTGGNDSIRRHLSSEFAKHYYKVKREQIRFIVTNPGSLAAVYALYQRLPNDNILFNGENDIVYYRLVADSVEVTHPKSPYLRALKKDIDNDNANAALGRLIEQAQNTAATANYPDLDMADMYGKKVKLSSLNGKVILLDFWSATATESRLNNAELKEMYNELKSSGFEIYQVSLDTSKPLWVTTVQDQKLPWISVCDFKGANSSAARLFNIQSLPTNFLIDRQGNIAGKNLSGTALKTKIKQLL